MVRKSLSEAAREILGEKSLRPADKASSGEPIGAGVNTTRVDNPLAGGQGDSGNPTGVGGGEPRGATDTEGTTIEHPQAGGELVLGPRVSLADTGLGKASNASGKATPPGKSAPVGQRVRGDDHSTRVSNPLGEEDEVSEEPIEEEEIEEEDEVSEEPIDEEDLEEKTDDQEEEVSEETIADRVKAIVQDKKSSDAMQEDMKALFSGEKLSENFMKKAKIIFETAVIARATSVCEQVENDFVDILGEYTDKVKNELTEQVDDYLNYMVEEWVKENEVAIEKGIRAELAEDFISGLKNLFVEHYIDIPEDKVQVVEELAGKVEELEGKINEEIDRAIELTKQLVEYKRKDIVKAACEGLTETQIQKITEQAANVEFVSDKEFKLSVKTLRESYFPANPKVETKQQLDEESVEGDPLGVEEEDVYADPEVAQYAKAISKGIRKG